MRMRRQRGIKDGVVDMVKVLSKAEVTCDAGRCSVMPQWHNT